MRLQEIADALGAVGDTGERESAWVTRVQTDSRCIEPGDVFICLPGTRFDGHNFAPEAARKGAVAVVSQQPMLGDLHGAALLVVPDTVKALGRLAAAWRARFAGTVVAVTASAGKTTVKELLAAVLAEAGSTAKNFKNWNNQIGLPLSMLACTGEEAFWVMEAGISRVGDMDDLGSILSPNLTVVSNVGAAHLEGLGDETGVAREKCKLIQALMPDGRAVVSRDYPLLVREAEATGRPLVKFSGRDHAAPCFCTYQGAGENGRGRYLLRLKGREARVELPWRGGFMAENILAAACTAAELGLDMDRIVRGMARAKVPEHRFHALSVGDFKLIDDCYNANPLSMLRSIESAADQAGNDPLVLVLGEMGELGDHAVAKHEELGRFIAASGSRAVFFQGEQGRAVRSGLEQAGWSGQFVDVHDVYDLVHGFKELGITRGTILVKGSRACGLERYVRELTEELGA